MFPTNLRMFVATVPIDLRISFDRLAAIVRDQFGDDPRSGALFFFTNKAMDRCKILFRDRTGYCVLYKRLDASTFSLPKPTESSAGRIPIDPEAFARLLEGVAKEPSVVPRKVSKRRLH